MVTTRPPWNWPSERHHHRTRPEAIEVASWDTHFIGARLHRALHGIAAATGDADAAAIADELRGLQADVEETFPDADKFIRPGFDQLA
jgi:hypothetical protein